MYAMNRISIKTLKTLRKILDVVIILLKRIIIETKKQ